METSLLTTKAYLVNYLAIIHLHWDFELRVKLFLSNLPCNNT